MQGALNLLAARAMPITNDAPHCLTIIWGLHFLFCYSAVAASLAMPNDLCGGVSPLRLG
jgi:hypothetical protein